ncbi:sugar ABC transporter ATP-binding protein [Flexilinea flocculi]|jgi:ABC-type sugar transport system ATPase subunit|uniref:ABC-type sugar transport system, ATPase component n=1 Tax=Flexilinea flocculi TaxID=1678840 RepID=A0A0S7BXT4_9CHLR|nr:sugar ABC transporter ATP-binding protein [Flexilinea flocculi]NMB92898.1 sugar ABC transporter ATP-binding protein [Flexilinea flocculi]GAP41465.1 ABC-type sugar transport system, ATPase component [Flexilinea flocculi]
MADLLIKVSNLSKNFSGVHALSNVNFEVYPGEIHAIVGENGAGKSTLMNILSGVYRQTSGDVFWNGKIVHFRNVKEPRDIGIVMIHQELSLAQHLSVMENIYMGNLPKTRSGMIDYRQLKNNAIEQLKRVRLDASFATKMVNELSISQQQMVEIAKALTLQAKLLIMDEPTSCLTAVETEVLLDIMKDLRTQGVSILFISHRMEEVFRISDRITVLRDGSSVASALRKDIEVNEVLSLMVGREYSDSQVHTCCANYEAEPILKVENLCYGDLIKNASFELYPSEVLFITGLVGAGRSELIETIFGGRKMSSGKIFFEGKEVHAHGTKEMMELGISLVPEGRKIQGIFANLSVADNIQISALKKFSKAGVLNIRQLRVEIKKQVDALRIKTPSVQQLIRNLSGGNQQKAVLGRCLMCSPRILILDEPTNGIDVGTKQEIYRIIDRLAHEGVSVICVSSEMAEVLSMADRAIVMHEGKINGILKRDGNLTQDTIVKYETRMTDCVQAV